MIIGPGPAVTGVIQPKRNTPIITMPRNRVTILFSRLARHSGYLLESSSATRGCGSLHRGVIRSLISQICISFALWCQPHFSQTGSLFPSFVEFQYSLFHPVCRFVVFPVLVHALPHMEQTRLFSVLRPHEIISFVSPEDNTAVQACCQYSTGFWH
jgi:hypothetical protein